MHVNAVFTFNAYDQLFLMSVNGKTEVIKGPTLCIGLANQIHLNKIFLAKPYFQSKKLLILLSKNILVENTRGMNLKYLILRKEKF